MRTRKFRDALLAITLAAAVTVPAAAQPTAPQEGTPATTSERTTVRVVNDNWLDITVYAVRAGYPRRLGTVTSFTTRVFTLPSTLLTPSDDLRLIADPIGSRGSYTSEGLLVNPGDVVEWRVLNNIGLSNIFIHRPRVEGG